MQFSDLILEKIILEVRYDPAYLFWDNSGKTTSQIVEKYPKFQITNVALSNVLSNWWDEGIVVNFTHEKADVSQEYPQSLETFKGVCSVLCEALKDRLEIRSFKRVGIRYILIYPRPTREAARDLFTGLKLLSIGPDKLQPFGAGVIEEEQVLLRFEDTDRGWAFRLLHAPREVSANVSRPLTIKTDSFHKNVITFDVDCYGKKPVEVPAFVAPDFIRITRRTIEDNLLGLVGL